MENNIPAVLEVMKHIYNTIIYAELNTKSDHCNICGYDGEIEMVENESGKLIWRCPNCGTTSEDNEKFANICRRVCGYLSTNSFNQGRMGDIHDRVLHL